MKNMFNIVAGIIVLLVAVVIGGVFYTIDETEQVVVTQFGKLIGEPKKDAGLHMKLPWQTVTRFDKRILEWDGDADQIPTSEKRLIWVDTTARWRISDPLKFMQRIRTEQSAQTRLDDIIDAKTREVISSHVLIEVLRNSNRLIEEGQKHILLNLAGTKIVNSIGISILIEIIEKMLEIDGKLAFCSLTPTIEKTFHIMGLAQYASIFPDEDTAVSTLRS